MCADQDQIAESIRTVMSRILSLHAEADALNKPFKKTDLDKLERIDNALEKAFAKESSLLKEFQDHIRNHGCRAPKAVVGPTGMV